MFPFARTLDALKKANLFSLMVAGAALAMVVVLGAVVAISWITAQLISLEEGWLAAILHLIVSLITGIAGWFMLPAFAVLIAGMFQEKVINRVESIYYPDYVRREESRFWPDACHDIKFSLWALSLNLLVLPLYLFGIGLMVSVLLNSYLVGREFFESAAGYHLGKPKAKELGQQNRGTLFGGGFFITLMSLIPLLNLFVPIIATVWMVHVYHRIRRL